jgi:hypothetical protein
LEFRQHCDGGNILSSATSVSGGQRPFFRRPVRFGDSIPLVNRYVVGEIFEKFSRATAFEAKRAHSSAQIATTFGIDVPQSINDHRAPQLASQFSRMTAHVADHEWSIKKIASRNRACKESSDGKTRGSSRRSSDVR